jgi:hypothetical protein
MVIATEEDLLGRAWLPLGRPHRLIASRLVTLAQATLKAVQAEEMTPQVSRPDHIGEMLLN